MKARRLTAAAAGLVLALGAACSGDSDPDTVLAAEDVIEGEIIVVPDPAGTSATVLVTTTLDMVCAVVYGTTPELGDGIATDNDMAGGAHTDHQAVLVGLEPDTEYYFRVQGTGSDGALYRSSLRTFRTPAADSAGGAQTPGQNVAVGATVVAVSSEFSRAFAATNAVDGDPATEWSTAGDGDDAWITIDLGEPIDVTGIGFRIREMNDGTAIIRTFTITVDGGEPLGPFEAGPGLAVVDVEVTGQVIRLDAVETTGGNTGAAEIEIYSSRS